MHSSKLERNNCIKPHLTTIDELYNAKHDSPNSDDSISTSNEFSHCMDVETQNRCALDLGDAQSMIFLDTDPGPVCVTAVEHKEKKHPMPAGLVNEKPKNE